MQNIFNIRIYQACEFVNNKNLVAEAAMSYILLPRNIAYDVYIYLRKSSAYSRENAQHNGLNNAR